MNTHFEPKELDEICNFVLSHDQIRIFGNASKIKPDQKSMVDHPIVSTRQFHGIVEHQASDFTITARSGTPVSELVKVLKQKGQFLPFDPVFADKGATVGGLVASGLNGPCRLRFGGIRDFTIGCQFVNGRGQAIRAGGRVVKNAAGFDLPKFMIGTAGRFGLLTEITFKVFPLPSSFSTVIYDAMDITTARKLTQWLTSLFDFDALDISLSNQVLGRLSGHSTEACSQQIAYLRKQIPQRPKVLHDKEDKQFWRGRSNLDWLGDDQCLVKVPMVAEQLIDFDQALARTIPESTREFSSACNVGLVALKDDAMNLAKLNKLLDEQNLAGQIITGGSSLYLVGKNLELRFLEKIKSALDPKNRFAGIRNA